MTLRLCGRSGPPGRSPGFLTSVRPTSFSAQLGKGSHPRNLLASSDMKVKLHDVHNALDAVLRGRKTRETVAAWAHACLRSDYDHRLTIQPAGERERTLNA